MYLVSCGVSVEGLNMVIRVSQVKRVIKQSVAVVK